MLPIPVAAGAIEDDTVAVIVVTQGQSRTMMARIPNEPVQRSRALEYRSARRTSDAAAGVAVQHKPFRSMAPSPVTQNPGFEPMPRMVPFRILIPLRAWPSGAGPLLRRTIPIH